MVGKARDQHAARQQKSESDITADAGVAGSRANTDGNSGSYVGRTAPQFDAEVQESGAEARAASPGPSGGS
ncbi:hypothetical protein D3H54_12600 [Mycobacterium sp. ELW1]|nr:hypothetical protein D3H54_12600 [Mycobacterium sp. ELW1]